MNILVCIKQVPCPESAFAVDAEAARIDAAGIGEWQMNRFDAHALEAALQLRESGLEARIDAVSVGPSRCTEVLKRAVGMGADRAFLLLDDTGRCEDDPQWVASVVARWARSEDYHLILTGIISEDGMNGVTGPALAARLGVPWATAVVCLGLDAEAGPLWVERELEEGRRHRLELELPALLTVQSSDRTPRYPSLSNLLRAGRRPPECRETDAMAPPSPQRTVVSLAPPRRRRDGRRLNGSPEQKAEALIRFLGQRGVIREVSP